MAKPVELESRSGLFFVVASILALATIWSVYEEFFARRPWKDYQLAFFDLEEQRAQEALGLARAKLAGGETQAALAELEKQLAVERAKLADPATRAERAALIAEVRRLKMISDERSMEVKFEKSRLDAAQARREEALHHGEERDAFLQKRGMAKIEARIAEGQAKVDEASAAHEKKKQELDAIVGEAERLSAAIALLHSPVEKAEARVKSAGSQHPELTQTWLPDLGVIDRCENCHLGINRNGYSKPEEVVTFANAVMDRDGEESEVERRFGVPWPVVEEWMDRADVGEAIDDGVPQVFRTHPERFELLLKSHPPETFGCTPCHEGQGAQTKGVGALLGAKDFDHGRNDHYWTRPMLSTGNDEFPPYVQSTCPDCHGDDMNLDFAPALNKGQALMKTMACWGCHPIEGFPNDRKRGPTLQHLRAKTTPGWLLEWISYPRAWRPGTSMPNFWPEAVDDAIPELERETWGEKRDDEATAITAYLWKQASGADGYLQAAPRSGNAERGRELVTKIGCYGCHGVEEKDDFVPSRGSDARARAPKLSRIGEKTNYAWIWNWLKAPSALWHDALMPSLRLSDGEAADIATYLMTLGTGRSYEDPEGFSDPERFEALAEKGKGLVAHYGCFGCHDINGFEKAQRIGADLSAFGEKPTNLLAWGNIEFEGSHAAVDPHVQTWHNWTETKLDNPRVYRTDRIDTRMPRFDMNRDEIRSLLVFLRSRRQKTYPTEYMATSNPRKLAVSDGEYLIIRYNCRGCHVLREQGGQILSHYPDNPNIAPPELFSVGAKTRPNWLFHFLRNPARYKVRPWLEVRMPTFNWQERDATKLVEYFNALDGSDYPYIDVEPPTDPEKIAAGKFIFEKLRCTQCHLKTEVVPPTADLKAVSPNLANAKFKLRPQWVPGWLANPAAQLEGARMPAFWPDGQSPFPELLGGDAKAQMDAVRDYVLTIGIEEEPVAAGGGPKKKAKRGG